jgi:hypothetical protein
MTIPNFGILVGAAALLWCAQGGAAGKPATKPAASKPAASKPTAVAPSAPWPKLDTRSATELGQAIDSLKRTPTPEGVSTMIETIAGFGKGAVPYLYESLSRQKVAPADELSEEANRLVKALDAAVKSDDGPRVVGDCANRNALVRRFALRKVGEYTESSGLPIAKKALADPDEEARFEAALTCASLGSTDGLEVLRKTARDAWPQQGKRIRAAIERHRSLEATQKIIPGLKSKDWQDICAALRLLAGWGVRESAGEAGQFLDTTDNRIKENAINALRGIVDHEPPIERLSAFDLAEQAIAWKKKI